MSLHRRDPARLEGWKQSHEIRALRRSETSLRSRLQTIESDTFEVLQLYLQLDISLPIFANARAGCWYVPPSVSELVSAFKSSDGHYGSWSLSLRRPNLHVFKAAIRSGGAVVVDATRSGKRFPDALTRTVPIWCAAMSLLAGRVTPSSSAESSSAAAFCKDTIDNALRLHPSVVSQSERDIILGLFPSWLDAWKDVQLDQDIDNKYAGLPLRPLWISTDRPSWEDGLPSVEELGFIPIICISASAPVDGERKERLGRSISAACLAVNFPERELSYAHVQGGGDDEENWSLGITPKLFWSSVEVRNRVLAGPGDADVENQVKIAVMQDIKVAKSSPSISDEFRIRDSGIDLRVAPVGSIHVVAAGAAERYTSVIVLGASRPASSEEQEGDTINNDGTTKFFPLVDKRGKPDRKHAVCRAMGEILRTLRDAKNGLVLGCGPLGADSVAAVAVALVAWNCDIGDDGIVRRKESEGWRSRQEVTKSRVRSAMLSVLAERADLALSRAALLQINRFFQSPNPPSSI